MRLDTQGKSGYDVWHGEGSLMIDQAAEATLDRLGMDRESLVDLVATVAGERFDQPCTLVPRLSVAPDVPVSIAVAGGQVNHIKTTGVLSCFDGAATARVAHLSDGQDLRGLVCAAVDDALRKENDDVMRVIRDSDWPLRSWDSKSGSLGDVVEACNVIRHRANDHAVVGLASPGLVRAVAAHDEIGPIIAQQQSSGVVSLCHKVAAYFGLLDLRMIWGALDAHFVPGFVGFLWLGHMPPHWRFGSEALPSAIYKLTHKDHEWTVGAERRDGKLTIKVSHYVHYVQASGSLGCLFR